MKEYDHVKRTKTFSVDVIHVVQDLPRCMTTDVLGRQLLRAATSVGANYREACRARSTRDFISKIAIAEQEAEESLYWLDLLLEARITTDQRIADLAREANELTSNPHDSRQDCKEETSGPMSAELFALLSDLTSLSPPSSVAELHHFD